MPDSPTSEPESDFICDCEEWMRSACAGQPFFKEHEGKRYCVLHYPGKEKSADFKKAFRQKLDNEDFNFRGVWFPGNVSFSGFEFRAAADFSQTTFSAQVDFSFVTFSAAADFEGATFSGFATFCGATFSGEAKFREATFSGGADFEKATLGELADFHWGTFVGRTNFQAATFGYATFVNTTFTGDTWFNSAIFSDKAFFLGATFGVTTFIKTIFEHQANFFRATFSREADFTGVTFKAKAKFEKAAFADRLRFSRNENQPVFSSRSSLDLQFARVDRPHHVSFHTITLRPYWFVNVDARKFDFTNVEWDWRTIDEEIDLLNVNNVASPHNMLFIACRRLADNAEENHRYEEASKFRYMAMEARRVESWRGFAPWRLSWWYWLASGYGERVLRAFFVLLGILLLSAWFYSHVGFARWEPKVASERDVAVAQRDDVGAPLKFGRALTYSAGVMTFQKPEPRPATTAAQTVVLLETILGPVQAALLALAIRRRFMR